MQAMNGRVGEKYIKAIARELAKGLKAVHDADIIHRDIKGMFQQQPACQKSPNISICGGKHTY